ncbi:MAG: pyridoxal 5'-phosphate synthase glutaminase subunit PdxT [Planctomycetes bacterium]|nr:pyridoxal 5'-phosphate synthase glutaminase subunit PdxT [Planctomycetota bacterium]
MNIGVLALQGDFHAHGRVFEKLGVPWREVARPEDFKDLNGLVIPGGESSTFLKLLTPELKEELLGLAARGGMIYGTCAGALLLAREVLNPRQMGLGLLDMVIERNGYGRQAQSFVCRRDDPEVEGDDLPSELVFIRAPRIRKVHDQVRVLGRVKGEPVYVRHKGIMATTFHPELTDDPSVHLRLVKEIEKAVK